MIIMEECAGTLVSAFVNKLTWRSAGRSADVSIILEGNVAYGQKRVRRDKSGPDGDGQQEQEHRRNGKAVPGVFGGNEKI